MRAVAIALRNITKPNNDVLYRKAVKEYYKITRSTEVGIGMEAQKDFAKMRET